MSVRFAAMGGNAPLVRVAAAAAVVAAALGCSGDDEGGAAGAALDECDWPTWGRTHERTFSAACDSAISPETVGDLRQSGSSPPTTR